MILEIDMGNSRIKWRLRSQSARLAGGVLDGGYESLVAELLPSGPALEYIWVASVLDPEINQKFSRWCVTHLGLAPEFAQPQRRCAGVINGYRDFGSLGVDRWLAMVAAFSAGSGPVLVVQAGSAITVDLISGSGQHLGGYIGPGLGMMRRSLGSETDRVNTGVGRWQSLSLAPGDTTEAAVQAALGAMALGVVDRGLCELNAHERSYGGYAEPVVCLAGGDGAVLAKLLPRANLVPELVLDGLVAVLGSPGTSGQEL